MMSYREILRFPLQKNDEIVVEAGVLWLTFSGRDFVLLRGDRFRAPEQAEAMLQGLSESGSQFRLVQTATPNKAAFSSLRLRVFGWLHNHKCGNGAVKGTPC